MTITLHVGNQERHRIEFRFEQVWLGLWHFSVDGRVVDKGIRAFGLGCSHTFGFAVGSGETSKIEIVKTKRRIGGGILPQAYRVLVNDKEVVDVVGY